MAGKEAVWTEIIQENELVTTELEEITSWWFVDAMLSIDIEHLDNMNKSKEHGFLGFRNTINSFNAWIDKMKASKAEALHVFGIADLLLSSVKCYASVFKTEIVSFKTRRTKAKYSQEVNAQKQQTLL
ncbi:unnamed protein product [Triticum turgidum subsp. durum]|uniref:Uncharacterized protein n=1 Tax=Triticum turgidum subsp. durum TaxID=4567 RepID=A0A9R0S116_TRITD|nr:unnamed protein product [Triticum turgidum subsp. durum]